MQNIYEIARDYKIPVTKLKRLHKSGLLICDTNDETGELEKIKTALRRGNLLNARQLVLIARDNLKIQSLGDHAILAKRQLRRLGDFRSEHLPAESFNVICDAASRDLDAARSLSAMLAELIPESGCDYHFLAVRCLYAIEPRYFEASAAALSRAILEARKFSPLADCSETKNGKTHFFGKNAKNRLTFDL